MSGKVTNRILANNYKQIADKIIQQLDIIRNSRLSDKRWVWELMQNAKDVPNKFKYVSIKIELWHDKLVFSHNGDHFTDADLTGLIQQVSSKDSANEGEQKQTGKFGTGFIATHLLSNVIDVSGVVKNPNTNEFQKFNLTLDRSARKSEDMIQGIIDNIEWVRGLDEDNYKRFPIAEGYETRAETEFNTSFTYHLNEDNFQSAKVGLDDLINTLPITMVSLPEIKSVSVENHTDGTTQRYACTSNSILSEQDREITESCIEINSESKRFLTYKTFKDGVADVALSIEIRIADDGRYELVARKEDQPVLFRDFPLIGTEKFYFPYMLNGFDFDPTDKRDGIFLNKDEPKALKNRAIIERAISAVMSFNEWLLSREVHNTYLMASSREPIPSEPWDDKYATPWIETQMKEWHEALLKQPLLETHDGYVELSKMKLPVYSGFWEKKTNQRFYEFLSDFKVSYLPLSEQLYEWANVIPWAKDVRVSRYDFLEDLQRKGNVSSLANHLGKTESDTYTWLNDLYRFIIEQGDLELLNKYPIVPNQSGNFCLVNNLVNDSEQRIPERLKTITTGILDRDLHDELLLEEIDASIFGANVRDYKLDSLIHEANNKIAASVASIQSAIYVESAEWKLVSKCVYGIIALCSNNGDGEEKKRGEMYQFVSHFVGDMPENQCIENLPPSLWTEADKFIVKSVPYLIESKANTIPQLGENLLCCPERHSEEQCICWFNDFHRITRSYGMSIPTSISIYPNQTGELKPLKDLHYDKGIPSEVLNLHATAYGVDLKETLLDRRILEYENHSPLDTQDIYQKISEKFRSDDVSESKKLEIAREAITMCPGSYATDSANNIRKVHGFLKKFVAELPDCREIENSTGFYWEIFVANILKEVCKRISITVNVCELSNVINENEEDTVKFVDSVLDFAMTYASRYKQYVTEDHSLWINQNGDFCEYGKIFKDDNIDDEIKNLATNPIVGVDFKEKLLRKNMGCERFIPQEKIIGTKDILVKIDDKISEYHKSGKGLQNRDFGGLIIALNSIVNRNHGYSASLKYFDSNKDRLIVGSIEDADMLSFIGSIVSSPEKMELMQRINKFPISHLEKMAEGKYVVVSMEELTKYYDNIDPNDLPTMAFYEDDSISLEERISNNEEAQKVVFKLLEKDGFDTSNLQSDYSLVNGVKLNNDEYPLVVKSYKSSSYQFRLNPNEWKQIMRSGRAMLLVHRGNGVVERVTFSNLFRNQDSVSLHFRLEALENAENLSKLAETLQYFKGCKFDFSNLLTTRYEPMRDYRLGQNNPNAFLDLSPDDKNLID